MRTNKQVRSYIAEIVSIHTQIFTLNLRKRMIAKKLGYGTWRSSELPGVTVVCGHGTNGWTTQWKFVAKALADRLGLSAAALVKETWGHRKRTHATPTVSVKTNKAKLTNPALKVY